LDKLSPKDYWESRLKDNFGLHGTGFIGLGKNYNKYMYRIRKRVLLQRVKRLHLDFANIKLLDIGSGTGFYIGLWKSLGVKNIAGIDITSVAIENLRTKYADNEFYQLDIGDDNNYYEKLGHKKFDIISAFDVLFHIVDDSKYERAIKNISTLLKAGGLFIFSDNFLHGDTVRATNQVSRSLTTIQKILEQNNFEVVLRRPMFVLMSTPIDSTRRIMKLIWRIVTSLVQRGEGTAYIVGGIMYPLELLLVTLIKESPSTEIMICKSAS
jgi:SAM-dependent methyltransferase